jgi:hypothetical protein
MLRVISVQADGSVVVSTRNFRRVVDDRGRVLIEFVNASNAKNCVEIFNSCFPNGESWAESITYREAYRRQQAAGRAARRVPRRRTA